MAPASSLLIGGAKQRVVLLDEEDRARLSKYRWRVVSETRGNQGYAARNVTVDGRASTMTMHREVLGLKIGSGEIVDHINGDTFDNRKCNLRVCDRSANATNAKLYASNRSGVKGVFAFRGGWRAQIRVNKRTRTLGDFSDLADAAEFRQLAAEMVYGEYANHGR